MPTFGDRVKETTATTGTGTVTLGGAAAGYQAFSSAFADQDVVYYCLTDGTNWEVGQGTFSATPDTLSRDTVVASSNAGALVNFPGPTTTVFNTYPATTAVSMVKNKIASTHTVRVAQDDNMIFADELLLDMTSEVWLDGSSELVGVA
jgi:hypothetical protein